MSSWMRRAATAGLSLVIAGAAMAFCRVSVVTNSLRLSGSGKDLSE